MTKNNNGFIEETDATILQMDRDQRSNIIKFYAMVLLVGIIAFSVVSIALMVPDAVMSIMGQR